MGFMDNGLAALAKEGIKQINTAHEVAVGDAERLSDAAARAQVAALKEGNAENDILENSVSNISFLQGAINFAGSLTPSATPDVRGNESEKTI